MRTYKTLSLILMALFAATGMLFLLIPDRVLGFFNTMSSVWGMAQSPLTGFNFYLILAVGYMYVVSIMAFLMFRHPGNRTLPLLLTHAKFASSILSLALFFQANYLIYLANFVVDGLIGCVVLTMLLKTRGVQWASS